MKNGGEIELEFTTQGLNDHDIREDGLKMVHFQEDQ